MYSMSLESVHHHHHQNHQRHKLSVRGHYMRVFIVSIYMYACIWNKQMYLSDYYYWLNLLEKKMCNRHSESINDYYNLVNVQCTYVHMYVIFKENTLLTLLGPPLFTLLRFSLLFFFSVVR